MDLKIVVIVWARKITTLKQLLSQNDKKDMIFSTQLSCFKQLHFFVFQSQKKCRQGIQEEQDMQCEPRAFLASVGGEVFLKFHLFSKLHNTKPFRDFFFKF